MTDAVEKTRLELFTTLNNSYDEAQARAEKKEHGYVLINADATLMIGQTDVDNLRFVGPTSRNVTVLSDMLAAQKAAFRWNRNLSETHRKAGCTVEVVTLAEGLARYMRMISGLRTSLNVVGTVD
jgi:hypothetical protein